MLDLFLYNWQVREDWFRWGQSLTAEDLNAARIGGMGSILENLIHIIDCELLWINYMHEESYNYPERNSITQLDDVINYSEFTTKVTKDFIMNLPSDYEDIVVEIKNNRGTIHSFTYGKILMHIVTHEIHHIGQLSIWSREIDIKPVSSDLIIRNYS
ncbi:DinB family protein [Mesobacillus jeotgali]|uniref:DinB family protein n=1 Tax=Mesobacillus jeotgali TaxID=129985 RepID=UPI0009A84B98|nr:DinB family protein [Mesobacillus jeotgali]